LAARERPDGSRSPRCHRQCDRLQPGGRPKGHEWAGEVAYDAHRVHTVLAKFHGDLGTINQPSGTHIDYWLSLTKKNGCWVGITNASEIPELGGAWLEDVQVENVRSGPDPPYSPLVVNFEAHVDPSSDEYLLLDLAAHFV
jgi:hypothetical protein